MANLNKLYRPKEKITKGDLWKDVLGKGVNLAKVLKRIEGHEI